MSRFFNAGSDSDTESSSGEEIEIVRSVINKNMAFMDEDDDAKRIVRSAKDKRFTELKDIIRKVKNHKKIRDMANILTDFDEMVKAFEKSRKVIEKEGSTPRFYSRYLVELEDFVTQAWDDKVGRKALSKSNARSLTSLRQKLKRHTKEFEKDMVEYRVKPDIEGESCDDDSGSDEESEDEPEVVKEIKKPAAKKVTYDEDSDSYWNMSSDSESSSDSDDNRATGQMTADFFLKKVDKTEDKHEKKIRKIKVIETKDTDDEDDKDGGEWKEVKGGATIPVAVRPKMFTKDSEITVPNVLRKLHEIISVRGKKNTDNSEQMLLLEELRKFALDKKLGIMIDVKIMFNIVSSIFDYNVSVSNCMRTETWERSLDYVSELLTLLMKHNETILCSNNIPEDIENLDAVEPQERYFVRGCILTYVEKLDDEFTKMLQACDVHCTDFVVRLKDETRICSIIVELQQYLECQRNAAPLPGAHEDFRLITEDNLCRAYLKRVEHMYYKSEYALHKSDTQENKNAFSEESKLLMQNLCKYIYKHDSTDRLRTRAVLAQVYHHAIHDRWVEGRDLMLMSHLQETITFSDIPTQILYNRATVQLGLSAFRNGYIKDAHNCIVDIQSSGRAKELLAQGLLLQRQSDRTPEQEKIEKRRLMPYHMHINLELLECVYLISAMLIEIPYMAAHEFDARRRMISKNFHYVMRTADNMSLVGPPESMREHIVAASRAMKKGDWSQCYNFVVNPKMDNKVWHLFFNASKVKAMLIEKIKVESLRTYLFTYSSVYDSISLDTLTDMFEMKLSVVQTAVNKLIIQDEIMASMHEPTNNLVMHRTEPSHLQALALQLSEKLSSLVDYNERALDFKSGSFFVTKTGANREGQSHKNSEKREQYQNNKREGSGGYQNQQYGNRQRYQQRQNNNY